jgi:hypothetical protein
MNELFLIVGTSPQHAVTTSGSVPLSLLAHFQIPIPEVQYLMAASISTYSVSFFQTSL